MAIIDMAMLHDEDNLRRVEAYLETLPKDTADEIGDCPDVVGGGTETCTLCGERLLVPWLYVCYPCVNGPCDHIGTDRVRWSEYFGLQVVAEHEACAKCNEHLRTRPVGEWEERTIEDALDPPMPESEIVVGDGFTRPEDEERAEQEFYAAANAMARDTEDSDALAYASASNYGMWD